MTSRVGDINAFLAAEFHKVNSQTARIPKLKLYSHTHARFWLVDCFFMTAFPFTVATVHNDEGISKHWGTCSGARICVT